MATFDWGDLKVEIDNAGGTLVDISAYVEKINGINIEGGSEEVTPAGAAATYALVVDIDKVEDITIEGVFDDTATTGPWALMGGSTNRGAVRSLKLTYGSTITRTIETLICACDPVLNEAGKTWYRTLLKNASATITET